MSPPPTHPAFSLYYLIKTCRQEKDKISIEQKIMLDLDFNIRAPLTVHKHFINKYRCTCLLKRPIKFAVIVILYDNLWWLGTKSQRKRYLDILVLLTSISYQPRHFETAAALNFFSWKWIVYHFLIARQLSWHSLI